MYAEFAWRRNSYIKFLNTFPERCVLLLTRRGVLNSNIFKWKSHCQTSLHQGSFSRNKFRPKVEFRFSSCCICKSTMYLCHDVVRRARGSGRRSSTPRPPRSSSSWRSQSASGVPWRRPNTSRPLSCTCCAATCTVCCSWRLLKGATTAPSWPASLSLSGR